METAILILIFILGTVFGSFYTLSTYRIPKKQDIVHTRSYCPNCNHKLGFFDMFPVLSYIFLGGKCRYCKQKISPRYILLEVFSGLVFVLFFYLLKINLTDIKNIEWFKIYKFGFLALYITFVFLIAGIDKENRKIERKVSVYGIIISLIYIAYLCIVEKANIYRYAIYSVCYLVAIILDIISLKKFNKNNYINGLVLTLITMAIFTGEIISLITVIYTILITLIYILIEKIKTLKLKQTNKIAFKNLNIGFFMGIANVITYIIINIFVIK